MEKIIILAPYPADSAPSQRFRFEQYLPELSKKYSIEIHPFLNEKGWKVLYKQGHFLQKAWFILLSLIRRFCLLPQIYQAQHVFIHREASQIGPPIFEFIIAKILRKKYIFDFDDAIWIPNYSESNATFQRLKAYWKIKFVIRWAKQITVGNQFLASYAKQFNSNVQVIPTTIDTDYHKPLEKETNPKVVIGWTGSHTTMQYLPLLLSPIKKLSEKYDIEFVVISNENPNLDLANFRFVRWNKESEMNDLSSFDIGVMPLMEDLWSSGKCGFKALQYLAMETPTVLSPVGVNMSIVSNGVEGFFAQSEDEWLISLEKLISDSALRKEMGRNGREKVIQHYSVQSQMEKYFDLFNKH